MSKKRKATTANSIQQAELILHLYELRRETVMREARSYIGGEFLPASAKEFLDIVSAGGKHTAFVLQVYGYWDIVAAFVEHGALDAKLVHDTCQEMYFQYAKIQPWPGRAKISPRSCGLLAVRCLRPPEALTS